VPGKPTDDLRGEVQQVLGEKRALKEARRIKVVGCRPSALVGQNELIA
jgi:hypothetical protein